MIKRVITGLLTFTLLVNLFVVGVFAEEPAAADPANAEATTTQVSADYELVTTEAQSELYVNGKIGAFAVKNTNTGYIWYSAVPSDTYDRKGLTPALIDQLNSLFTLSYTELNVNDNKTQTFPINNMAPKISTQKINKGVRITYLVDKINLEISIDVVLNGNSVEVTIPLELLKEGTGTQEKMNQYLDVIRELMDDFYKAIEETDAYGLSSNKSSLKKSKKLLDELKGMVDSLDSVVGVAQIHSRAQVILLDNVQIYLLGGKGDDKGVFNRVIEKADPEDKTVLTKRATQLKEDLDFCAYYFGLLKSVKYGGIVEIDLCPNMGASADHEEGYIFYPDGSGAITYNTPNHGKRSDVYQANIYSESKVNMAWENQRDATGIKRTMIPVYGSKKGDNAFVSIIEDGEENAAIVFIPSGNVLNLNRIYAKFNFRNSIEINSSSEFASGMATIFEKEIRDTNAKLKFTFLENDQANYSGMANAYREHLLDKSLIQKSEYIKNKIPLALDFVVGTTKSMIFYQQFVPLSTFDEISSVLDDMKAQDITNVYLHMSDWTKDYTTPTNYKISSAAGGKEGLKALVEKSHSLGGNTFLQTNMVDADIWESNIDQSKLALNSNLRIHEFDTWWYKLFSPLYILENTSKMLDKNNELGAPGIANNRMGSLIYFDYSTKYKATRGDTADAWATINKKIAEQNTAIGSYGGNQYILANNDWLLDIPMSSTGYTFSDESVPFYQMVVHGLIPYSAKPFNHFYDREKEKLQTIEYGSIPLYKLTYRDSTELRKIYYGFTTPYDRVKNDIIENYKEFDENLSQFADQFMIMHEKVNSDIVVVTYSNGKKIYINYSSEDLTYEGFNIPALDYVIR